MKKLICLIEDDFRQAKLIEKRLTLMGFEVIHFQSGDEYLEHHDTGLQALYLVNEKLPGMQAIDIVKRIRLVSPIVPIMVIADEDENEGLIRILRAGADEYHTPPINLEELAAKVNSRWNKFILLNQRNFVWRD